MTKIWVGLLLLAAASQAANHEVVAKTYYRTFNRAYPVLARIKPGDTVVTKTLDSGGQDYESKHLSEPGNPLTGPFFVEGAEAGDALVVRLNKVRLNRNWGYSGYRLGLVSLTPNYVEGAYSGNYKQDLVRKGSASLVPWDIDVARGVVRLREPKSERIKLEFPARPMLGCIGVAPAGDFAPTSGPAGSYGGNLDYNQIIEGSTVTLPVYHSGALLYIGDGHALQGDGEPIGNGVETSLDVEFTVELRKGVRLSGPRVETPEDIISVGAQAEFQSALDRALQLATTDMIHWLTSEYKLEPWAAHILIGYQGRYDVVTVAGSMALRIPKRLLPPR
jgi:amidase